MELIKAIPILAAGFFMGIQHALDTDHLVAVSTIVSQSKSFKRSAILGVLWGSGHTTTLLLAGLFVLGLRLTIPKNLGLFFEYLVGIVLIVLGVMLVRNIKRSRLHIHSHNHDGIQHIHLHSHSQSALHRHEHRAFLVGTLHGLAGSASLMLIILSTISSLRVGIFYIIFFGLGSILGMLIFAGLFSLPFLITTRSFSLINRGLTYLVGFISISFGFYMVLSYYK